jgi:exopolysaccharide biosynthesis WecB/TagA/CpsF family protein
VKFGAPSHQVEVNVANEAALFTHVRNCLESRQGFGLATLNLDHLTKLPKVPAFVKAYRAQEYVVADGRPIVWLSRLAGQPVDLLPGSEMIAPLSAICAEMDLPVAFVGSTECALSGATKALTDQVPGLNVIYTKAPPFGFEPGSDLAAQILKEVADSGAAICFIALGAPKQEIFAARGRKLAPDVGFASIGAGLDFFAGTQIRAPMIMRLVAMEWLWRVWQDPKRMVPRYTRCFLILPKLIREALRARRSE